MSVDGGVFIRVECACGRPEVFLKCERCARQSLFALSSDGVSCACGATYSHGVCACGEEVHPPGLVAVPFEEGPIVASEYEFDPRRVTLLVVVGVTLLVALAWWLT